MADKAVPEFTGLASQKLAELQRNGYRITGYCFERDVEGTRPQRGFIDSWGFVGWWRPEMVPGSTPQPTQAQAGAVPLTDEQIVGVMHSIPINAAPSYHIAFARAIEQAHGIGETP